MYIVFLLLLSLETTPPPATAPLTAIEVDGAIHGEFGSMQASDGTPQVVVLKDGWASSELFKCFGPALSAASLASGRHHNEYSDCELRTVRLVQRLGRGMRSRERSWVLIDACPVAWEISVVDHDGKISLKSLKFATQAIAGSL